MNAILNFLQGRNSAPRLTQPGPSSAELETILAAAMRAPDHAWLRPWRFIAIEGERRNAFGEVLQRSLLRRDPGASKDAMEKACRAPLRAPLLLAVAVHLQEHPKVPEIEQWLSAGCAAHGALLAAEAQGYAGVWRTGEAAFDPQVMAELGLAANEKLVGFLYIGSRDGSAKSLPQMNVDDYLQRW